MYILNILFTYFGTCFDLNNNNNNKCIQVSVRLHTEDGLSVAVPRSLLVADSLLMREVVATCAACPGRAT